MSWMGGTELMEAVIEAVRRSFPSAAERAEFFGQIIGAWEDRGCDWLAGLNGLDVAFDVALHQRHPDWGIGEGERRSTAILPRCLPSTFRSTTWPAGDCPPVSGPYRSTT